MPTLATLGLSYALAFVYLVWLLAREDQTW